MLFVGTMVNVVAVATGSFIGIKVGNRNPERINQRVFQALGIFTMVLGVNMFLKGQMMLVMVFSLIIGTIIGELLDLDKQLESLSAWIKKLVKHDNPRFSDGLITAFLLYCMGSLTILGAIEEGTGQGSDLLFTKLMMDGFSSIALASVFGIGVGMSVVPMFLFQGGLTMLAFLFGGFMAPEMINKLSAVGGILLVGLGFNILEIKSIKVMNMLMSILIAVVLAWLKITFIK